MSRNALNLNFIKIQYEDFTSCFFYFYLTNMSLFLQRLSVVFMLLFSFPLFPSTTDRQTSLVGQ